ncbi:MAG: nucleotidyltransferase family protein [Aeropyrum sp.]|nr:nucleotidyltransferase family protein [Aeropyrum sp.]
MPQDRTALVLAGGKGRRFRPYTDLIPKPMIPIGNTEKPILEFIVRILAEGGFKRIVLLVGYKWKYIYNYFGSGERYGVEIKYSIDDDKYKDTGGAVLKALKEGLVDSTDFLVWYGDILSVVDVADLYYSHLDMGADATLTIARRYQVPVGVVDIGEGGKVVGVVEKPWVDLRVFIGMAVFKKSSFMEHSKHLGTSFDIMGDLMPRMAGEAEVYAYYYDGPWFDVGSLERYEKISEKFISDLEGKLFPSEASVP